MLGKFLNNRLLLLGVLLLVILGLSACYKDAGENVRPTSNVEVRDLTPATATSVPAPLDTPTPLVTATRTLVPTITPSDMVQNESVSATTVAPAQSSAVPSNTPPQIAPTFTPMISITAGPVITTPGMSDIQPSNTPVPTLDPALQPTPTAIPIEENKCIHVVMPNDTLYSIAQSNEVLLSDLVNANPSLLGGSQSTPLQIGWELKIPGCETGEPTPLPTQAETGEGTTIPPVEPGTETVHIVQAGETIYSIGRQYGVDPQAIIEANGLVNPDRINPGDQLIIPSP